MIMVTPVWEITVRLSTNENVEFKTHEKECYQKIVFALDRYRKSLSELNRYFQLIQSGRVAFELDLSLVEWVLNLPCQMKNLKVQFRQLM
jgi:hypothetical protein